MENEVIHLSRKLRRENRFCQQERSAIQNAYLSLLRSAEVAFQHAWCLHAIRLLNHSTNREQGDAKELWPEFCQLQRPLFKSSGQCLNPKNDTACQQMFHYLHANPLILVNFLRYCEDAATSKNSSMQTLSNSQWLNRMVFILFSSVLGFCQFPQDEDLLLLVFKSHLDTVNLSDISQRKRCLSGGSTSSFSLLLRCFLENLPSARRYLIATLRDPILWLLQQDEWYYDATHDSMMDRFNGDMINSRFGENHGSLEYEEKVANFRHTVVDELVSMTLKFVDSLHRTAWLVPIPVRYLLCLVDQNVTRELEKESGECGRHTQGAHRVQLISELVFDNFITPAIIDPESFGIVGDISISQYAKHNLMEVAKILHQLFINADSSLLCNNNENSLITDFSSSQPGIPIKSTIPQSDDLFAHFTPRTLIGFLTSLGDCFSESFLEQSRTDIIDPKPTSEGLQCVGLCRASCLIGTFDLELLCNAFRDFSLSLSTREDDGMNILEKDIVTQCVTVSSNLPQSPIALNNKGDESVDEKVVLVFPFTNEESQHPSLSCPGMLPENQVIQMATSHCTELSENDLLLPITNTEGSGQSMSHLSPPNTTGLPLTDIVNSPLLREDMDEFTPVGVNNYLNGIATSSIPVAASTLEGGEFVTSTSTSRQRTQSLLPNCVEKTDLTTSCIESSKTADTNVLSHHRVYYHHSQRAIGLPLGDIPAVRAPGSFTNELTADKLETTRTFVSSADDLDDMEEEVVLVDDEDDDVASLPSCSSVGAHSAPSSVPIHLSGLGRGRRDGGSVLGGSGMVPSSGSQLSAHSGGIGSNFASESHGASLHLTTARGSGVPPLSVSFAAVNGREGGASSSSSSAAYQGHASSGVGPSSGAGNMNVGGGSSSVASSGKRTRFSISHDRESLYNASDTQEFTSEMAPSEITSIRSIPSMDMESQEGDALSDMFLSANVSGRGTPSISGGRDSPLSTGGNTDLPSTSSTNLMHKSADVTDKFGKFDIPMPTKTLTETEARSTVSDTWSTDVLASDSEAAEVASNVANSAVAVVTTITGSLIRPSAVYSAAPSNSNPVLNTSGPTTGSHARMLDVSEDGIFAETASLQKSLSEIATGKVAAEGSQCSSSLSSRSALSHGSTSPPSSSPAISASYSATSISASSAPLIHTVHSTTLEMTSTSSNNGPGTNPTAGKLETIVVKSTKSTSSTTNKVSSGNSAAASNSRGTNLAQHLPNFIHQAIRGATSSSSTQSFATNSSSALFTSKRNSSSHGVAPAARVSSTVSPSSNFKSNVIRESISRIRDRLSVKSHSRDNSEVLSSTQQVDSSKRSTDTADRQTSVEPNGSISNSLSKDNGFAGSENEISNSPNKEALEKEGKSGLKSGIRPATSGTLRFSQTSETNPQSSTTLTPYSTTGAYKESVKEMLARYERRTSTARGSKVDSGASLQSLSNTQMTDHDNALSSNLGGNSSLIDTSMAGSSTLSFYDSSRPQSSPAWLDAKRKLRMVLQNVTVGTAASSLALNSRENVAWLLSNPTGGSHGGVSNATALQLMNLHQRDNALLRVLTAMLADAIQANEHYVCAQLQETIRVVSLFSPNVCQMLVRSMLTDCRHRRHYTAYLIQTREQLAIVQDWIDSWIRQYNQSLRALGQYVCNEVCNQLLQQESGSFVYTVRTLTSFVEESERRQLVQRFLQRIQRSLVRSVYHHPVPPSAMTTVSQHGEMSPSLLQAQHHTNRDALVLALEGQLRQCVERSVFTALYPHTMYLDDWVAERERDQLFQRELHHMAQTTSYRYYGVPAYCLSVIPFESAQQELRLLNCYKSPADKVACIKRVNDCIVHLLRMADHSIIPNADDVLPVLTFVIVQVNPKFLISNVKYVDMFYGDRLTGEDQYLWCQFCIAVEAIKKMLLEQQTS